MRSHLTVSEIMHSPVISERSGGRATFKTWWLIFLEILKRGPCAIDPRVYNYDYRSSTSNEFYNWNREICKFNGKISSSFELSNYTSEVSQNSEFYSPTNTSVGKAGWEQQLFWSCLTLSWWKNKFYVGKNVYKNKENS